MILLIGLCFAAHCLLFFLLLLLCCKTCPSHTLHWPARYRTAQVLFWFLPTTLRRTQTHLGRLFCPADRNITASAGCSFFLLRFLHWRSLMAVDRECRPSCDQVWVVVFSVVLQRVCKTVCVCDVLSCLLSREKEQTMTNASLFFFFFETVTAKPTVLRNLLTRSVSSLQSVIYFAPVPLFSLTFSPPSLSPLWVTFCLHAVWSLDCASLSLFLH